MSAFVAGWGERFNLSVYDSAYSSSEAAWLGAYFGHGDSWVDARTEVHECAELCPGSRYILHSEVGVNALKCKCMGITSDAGLAENHSHTTFLHF